jgi:hypothetical protein
MFSVTLSASLAAILSNIDAHFGCNFITAVSYAVLETLIDLLLNFNIYFYF